MATPHKDRLKALYEIYLHISRHLTQKSLDIRQYACVIFMQANEKSVCVSFAQSLCGIALFFEYDFICEKFTGCIKCKLSFKLDRFITVFCIKIIFTACFR